MTLSLDRVTHLGKYLAIYALLFGTMASSATDKLFNSTPQWFLDAFGGTWAASFPGLGFSWKFAGVLEAIVVLCVLVSLATLEWWKSGPKPFLRLGLVFSLGVFAMLAWGQRLVGEFDGAASLFFYFGATCVIWLVVRADERAVIDPHVDDVTGTPVVSAGQPAVDVRRDRKKSAA